MEQTVYVNGLISISQNIDSDDALGMAQEAFPTADVWISGENRATYDLHLLGPVVYDEDAVYEFFSNLEPWVLFGEIEYSVEGDEPFWHLYNRNLNEWLEEHGYQDERSKKKRAMRQIMEAASTRCDAVAVEIKPKAGGKK